MSNRRAFPDEATLQKLKLEEQRYSYDLTQRLTFFVVGIELVFCGYLLLHAERLAGVKYSSFLFLLAGGGALFGLLWRYSYNSTFHDITHYANAEISRLRKWFNSLIYYAFVLFSIAFLIVTLAAGYNHLRSIEKTAPQKDQTVVQNDS